MIHLFSKINESYSQKRLEQNQVAREQKRSIIEHNRVLMIELFNSSDSETFDEILKNLKLDTIDKAFVEDIANEISSLSDSKIEYKNGSFYDKSVDCYNHNASIMVCMRKAGSLIHQPIFSINYRNIIVIDERPELDRAYKHLDEILGKHKVYNWNWFLGGYVSYQSKDTYQLRVYDISKAKIHLDQ